MKFIRAALTTVLIVSCASAQAAIVEEAISISHLKRGSASAKPEEEFLAQLHHVLGHCAH